MGVKYVLIRAPVICYLNLRLISKVKQTNFRYFKVNLKVKQTKFRYFKDMHSRFKWFIEASKKHFSKDIDNLRSPNKPLALSEAFTRNLQLV